MIPVYTNTIYIYFSHIYVRHRYAIICLMHYDVGLQQVA